MTTERYMKESDVLAAIARVVRQSTPQWKTETPTKAGWYWVHYDGDESHNTQMVFVKDGQAHAVGSGLCAFSQFDLWCGPIEAPPLPAIKSAET